ncbi:hypothetical protein BJY00DRAFT_295039, partial [Aspergillus carlsbadensis]
MRAAHWRNIVIGGKSFITLAGQRALRSTAWALLALTGSYGLYEVAFLLGDKPLRQNQKDN